ncbi:MAG TPA: YkgJ family cysteine cluster protein [Candidatus Eremiobacteraceae bacterium]|nr:YkgJ family cysteine cluster protein [Candidatus Eremiobacteraceae bacterium]
MHPCESCTGECCKIYYVNLSGFDVWTIARGTNLAPQQFVDIAQEHEATGIGFKLDATKTTFAMVLAKNPGRDGKQQCAFLMEIGDGVCRCGIYPLRPAACRVFPARLRDGAVTFRDDIVCPKESFNADALDAPAWRMSLLRSQMEWAVYAAVVHRWNELACSTPRGETRTPDEYYAFLMDRYARLDALEHDLQPDELCVLIEGWGQPAAARGAPLWERYLRRAEGVIAEA